jgi:hypothetical protein
LLVNLFKTVLQDLLRKRILQFLETHKEILQKSLELLVGSQMIFISKFQISIILISEFLNCL